ncbi:MAG TPA: hypothetical protein VF468_22685 [Actinomycetota bacterium]|nr:hypothetical protein [Actinomycetota bacterium]
MGRAGSPGGDPEPDTAGAPDPAGRGGGAGRVGVAAGQHRGVPAGLVEQLPGGALGLAEDPGDHGHPEPPAPWPSTATVSSTGAPAARAAPPAGPAGDARGRGWRGGGAEHGKVNVGIRGGRLHPGPC